ncbi:MAG: 2-haloacid dehalogenase [Variovorax sp.]|nr:2-haloacid dehalogenase [Variovorax sp.]
MLNDLVRNTGIDRFMEKTISVDAKKIFKPSPVAYTLVEEELGAKPSETFFVSSNPWDVVGARAAGFTVAWIERVTPDAMASACAKSDLVPPLTMFKAVRMQMDELGLEPDYRIHSLTALPSLLL